MPVPILVEAEVWHPCAHIETTEKVEGATMVFAQCPAPGPNMLAHLVDIRDADPKAVLAQLRREPAIRKASMLYHGADGAIAYCAQPADSLFISLAAKHGGIVASNPVVSEGKDHDLFLFPDGRTLSALYRETKAAGFDLRIRTKIPLRSRQQLGLDSFRAQHFLRLRTVSALLTQRQREAFQLASSMGYYDLPQQTTLAALARELSLHPNTFSDHLRKAEAKLLPVLGKILHVM